MLEILSAIGAGVLAGAAYAFVGYMKANVDSNSEWGLDTDFNVADLLSTMLGAGIIAGLAVYLGSPTDMVATSALGVVVIQSSKKVVKIMRAYLYDKGYLN